MVNMNMELSTGYKDITLEDLRELVKMTESWDKETSVSIHERTTGYFEDGVAYSIMVRQGR